MDGTEKTSKLVVSDPAAEVRAPSVPSSGDGGVAAEWSRWLSRVLGEPWTVTFGRARATPVVARRRRGRSELRLHRLFRAAPEDVRDALGRWLSVGRRAKRASARLDGWIHEQLALLPARKRTLALEVEGEVHDLGRLSRELLASEFAEDFSGDRPPPQVTWGRRVASRCRRSLRLGSYEPEQHLVRMHPVLDQAGVPEWFVRFVLKHELLHAVWPPFRNELGRWVHHGPRFRARERGWDEYAAALDWERKNLARLLRSARSGSVLRVWAHDDPSSQCPPRRPHRSA